MRGFVGEHGRAAVALADAVARDRAATWSLGWTTGGIVVVVVVGGTVVVVVVGRVVLGAVGHDAWRWSAAAPDAFCEFATAA